MRQNLIFRKAGLIIIDEKLLYQKIAAPAGPLTFTLPSKAIKICDRSVRASPEARLPPIVPTFRTRILATSLSASQRIGKVSFTSLEVSSSRCVTKAPIVSPALESNVSPPTQEFF